MHPEQNTNSGSGFSDSTDDPAHEALIQRVRTLACTDRHRAEHLVDEILHYFNDTPEAFITRRHRELQQAGLNNPKIYALIAEELKTRRFHCPAMSLRQIRRVIYG